MFEQAFKNIDDILHKDAGCSSELDYVEQTSWVLFLKYLDDLEKDKKTSAKLAGKTHSGIISPEYCWEVWAVPKDKDGKIDHHKALTGDDLKEFVDHKLFPYLKKFKTNAESADTLEYKIGEIFNELKNKIQSGYNLREVINLIDELRFRSHAEKHEMSHLYEDKIKNMGNAGRNGGEYYTPRPLIKTIVKVVAPEIGSKIYDGALGSAGFLCEAFEYLKTSKNLTTKDADILQKKTFYGKEKKSLAYIIGTMNMILHGIEAPNIVHTNTLAENIADIQERDRYDIVLANPPFGGKERAEVQQNFPIKTGETAFLFLQHFIKILKAGGRAGVVIKNTFLSNVDNASVSLRKLLLESCNLHTVLDLPNSVFSGTGQKTVILFFEKGSPTRKIWFYELNLDRNLGRTNALNEGDLAEFIELQKVKVDSKNSWSINISQIDRSVYDLSVKNPHKKGKTFSRESLEILHEIQDLDRKGTETFGAIKECHAYLQEIFAKPSDEWGVKELREVCDIGAGNSAPQEEKMFDNGIYPFFRTSDVGKIHLGLIQDSADKLNDLGIRKLQLHKKGTLLFPKSGASTFLNHRVLMGCDGYVSSHLATLKAENTVLEDKFLFYFSMTVDSRDLMQDQSYPSLRLTDIEQIKIPLPPLSEQKLIVQKLDTLFCETRKLEEIYQQNLTNIHDLKKSILQKAFNGKPPEA
ncbi:MAG: N-6 DNA methylase [Candidatus Omnitrophica bacterium]|nr:N-6 DNA methylase [Candidatus Omnitrophota bacterium]